MPDATPRLALPFIVAGQAQREIAHNEALARIDAAVNPSVLALGLNDPPATPSPGQCWIVGTAPSGGWEGQADALAIWTDGGWRFVSPPDGMNVWLPGDGVFARYAQGGWSIGVLSAHQLVIDGEQVVGSRQAAIALPAGGATVDDQARATISAVVAALSAHGLIMD